MKNDGPACIVCGCTQNRACDLPDGPCSWVCSFPPVCSGCASTYMLAELWRLLWVACLSPRQKKEEGALHDLHHQIAKRGHLPPLRLITRLQRKLEKLEAGRGFLTNKRK
jgi:hypothetical protein